MKRLGFCSLVLIIFPQDYISLGHNVLNVDVLKKQGGIPYVNRKGKFTNKNLMFTGGFKNMSRSEAKAIAENNGGKVLGSISKKLDFLVVGDSKPTKKKVDQAKQLNIKIILEKDWNKILNS